MYKRQVHTPVHCAIEKPNTKLVINCRHIIYAFYIILFVVSMDHLVYSSTNKLLNFNTFVAIRVVYTLQFTTHTLRSTQVLPRSQRKHCHFSTHILFPLKCQLWRQIKRISVMVISQEGEGSTEWCLPIQIRAVLLTPLAVIQVYKKNKSRRFSRISTWALLRRTECKRTEPRVFYIFI